MVGYAKYVGLGIASLIFLLFMTRHIKRREHEGLGGEPTWLREIDGPRPLAALSAGGDQPTQMMAAAGGGGESMTTRRQLEGIVPQEPERVAAQVRSWMQEE